MKCNTKFILRLALIVLLSCASGVQIPALQLEKKQRSEFETWRQQAEGEYKAFVTKNERDFQEYREKINADFAEFMKRSWEKVPVSQAIPAPKSPDPVTPPEAKPGQKPTADPLPFAKVTPLPTPRPQPQPAAPIRRPDPQPKPVTHIPTPVTPPAAAPIPKQATPQPPVTPIPKQSTPQAATPDPIPVTPPKPQTVIPAPKPVMPPEKTAFSFLFYGTECTVTLDDTMRFSLADTSEQSVAEAWKILSSDRYNALIIDSLDLREKLNLSDWGYMNLLKAMSEKFIGKKAGNEAVLLQMFVLTQSGYKVRISRAGDQLALLVPFQDDICEYSYLNINGMKYYAMNKDLKGQMFYIFNHEFPKEQYFSWQTGQPRLAVKLTSPKQFVSKLYPEIAVSVQVNQNLIDYYNDYPLSSQWNLYALAGLSETVKQALYPVLQRAIAGKSKTQAAEMLLNFIQTGFAYQTDDRQFGYERSFFADENFFYPYNDCEDRAILYAVLIKELLDLNVVLVHSPGHLATAVHFPENVTGDHLVVDGRKFIICDPTYIGANIGMVMDTYKQANLEVIKL